jgi:HK97 family phage major capsid protein
MTAPAQPKHVAEWEEYLTGLDTPAKIGTALADKGETGFAARTKAYVTAHVTDATKEAVNIKADIEEFTKATIVDIFKANGKTAQAGALAAERLKLSSGRYAAKMQALSHTATAPGGALDGQFASLGEFVQTIWHNRTNGKQRIAGANPQDLDRKLEIVNGYSIKVPDSGGFLVPEEYRAQLLMLALEASIVMPRATVIPMNTQSLVFPTVDATSNASSVFGGIVVYRTEEGADFVESQAKFGKVKLDATKQTALAYLTNELIRESAPSVDAIMTQMLPQAIAYNADLDYLKGLGAGEPLGALSSRNPGLLVVPAETSPAQPSTTIVWENILRMYSRMLPTSIPNSVWIASPDTFMQLGTMALVVGTGGSAVWITDAHNAPQLTLLGRPVIMSEKTPGVLGQQGDLSLVDFTYYLVGIRDSLSIDTSDHVKFTSDQTTVRAIARNDGRPWLTSPITPQNGGPTLSPFITLGARP